MSDFAFLSDTDDSAVEELISQAQDLTVLEQVAAINCSGFTDSVLPADLDSRFARLKSFPAAKPQSQVLSGKSLCYSKSELGNSSKPKERTDSLSRDYHQVSNDIQRNRNSRMGLNPSRKSRKEYNSSSDETQISVDDSEGTLDGKLRSRKKNPVKKDGDMFSGKKIEKTKSISNSVSFSSPFGCFGFSPKKASKEKSKDKTKPTSGFDGDDNLNILSDLSTFSVKEQQRLLKKAMKEQQDMMREASRIVKWAKQSSARLSAHGMEYELSDYDNDKE